MPKQNLEKRWSERNRRVLSLTLIHLERVLNPYIKDLLGLIGCSGGSPETDNSRRTAAREFKYATLNPPVFNPVLFELNLRRSPNSLDAQNCY